jgi:hypothetical protein
MDTILPQTVLLPATRIGLRLAGDTTTKLKADPEYKHAHESTAMCHNDRWRSDCTRMLDLL